MSQARIYCSEQVYSRSTDRKASDWQGLGCGPGCSVTVLCCQLRPQPEPPPETFLQPLSFLRLLSPLLAQHPPFFTCPQQSATQPYHKVTGPLYPCSRGCVHCVCQPRAFLIVWDLLLRAPNSERASHCWVRKNPLQLCQLYKIQGFLCLRFILSHFLGETMPLHS